MWMWGWLGLCSLFWRKTPLLSLPLTGAGLPWMSAESNLEISMFRSVSSPYVGIMTLPIGRMGFLE